MLKKTIHYVDYNGVERKEDHYFNLNESELAKKEMGVAGGYAEMLKRVIQSQDGPTIMLIFNEFIVDSYGIKSLDGKRFEKSPEISKAFEQSEAYNVLFMELVTNAGAASDFINAIIPKKKASEQTPAPTAN